MTTRIIFNGQEYTSREAMPSDVRKAYDEAVALLRDADSNGVPDVLEAGGAASVVGVRQTSVTFNGRTLEGTGTLPGWVGRLIGLALSQPGTASSEPLGTPEENSSQFMDRFQRVLGVLTAFLAGFVLVFAIALILTVGGGREHLAGRLMVAIPAWFLLAWLDTYAGRLARRKESLLSPDSPGYRRYVNWSSAGLLVSAVLLLGLALYLP